jgi:hypothetical protein
MYSDIRMTLSQRPMSNSQNTAHVAMEDCQTINRKYIACKKIINTIIDINDNSPKSLPPDLPNISSLGWYDSN